MNKSIKIIITGDTFLGGGRVKKLVQDKNTEKLFGDFLPRIQNADISVTNLESPLIDEAPPILKTGPNLKSPVSSLQVLGKAGFNLVTLANNHIMDFGGKGLQSTLKACSAAGIATVGAGMDKVEADQPYIVEISGTRMGIVNIAENEFGTTTNGSPGAHALNPVQNYYRIHELSEQVDFVIVAVHGGHEYYSLPSPRMKETYRFFIDAGAAAVVGHHPHCYSGYEVYHGAPIIYSLGNFLFDNEHTVDRSWNEGFMVEFSLAGDKMEFDLIPYIQNAEEPGLMSLNSNEYLAFEENIARLNEIIGDDKILGQKFVAFCQSSRKLYSAFIEPHSNKYLHALQNRKLFPSLLGDEKKRLLLNLTRCEAHRDVLNNMLSS